MRKEVRALIEPGGGFVLVHIATPIEVCEERDRKGLYAKARAGILKEFTGISDPYEEPADADLVIDTTKLSPEESAQEILLYLEREGYVGGSLEAKCSEDLVQPRTSRTSQEALERARAAFQRFTPGEVAARHKQGDDPVTEADTTVDTLLREFLPRNGDGWLSEETRDDHVRLERRRVWVVDPLDGTREFVTGIPEWCVSIGLVVDGEPVAGGICNPVTGETIVGARGLGVTLNGRPATVSRPPDARRGAGGRQPQRGQARGVGGLPRRTSSTIRPWARSPTSSAWSRPASSTPPGRSPPSTSGTWRPASRSSSPPAAPIVTGAPEEARFNRPKPLLTRLIAANPCPDPGDRGRDRAAGVRRRETAPPLDGADLSQGLFKGRARSLSRRTCRCCMPRSWWPL